MVLRSPSVFVLSFVLATPLLANVITVDTLDDDFDSSPPCSLREAIEAANTDAGGHGCVAGSAGGDSILFDSSLNGEIDLTGSEMSITADVEIVVEPAHRIGVRAAPNERIFTEYGGILFRLQGLVLEGGSTTGQGGAIHGASNGQLEIADCIFRDNQAVEGGAVAVSAGAGSQLPVIWIKDSRFEGNETIGTGSSGRGGAVLVNSSIDLSLGVPVSARIERSVFLGNHAGGRGGAIGAYHHHFVLDRVAVAWNQSDGGGSLYFGDSSVDIQNSTVAHNAGFSVGGLSIVGLDTGHVVRIAHTTVTDNVTTNASLCGGACFTASAAQTPLVLVSNSILANNTPLDCDDALSGSFGFSTGGNNVFGDVTACTTPVASDLEIVSPLVLYYGEMASDARDTFVALPELASPVLDRIAEADCDDVAGAALTEDQRGGTRPLRAYIPLPGSPPAACDSGALERGLVEIAPWIFKDGFENGNPLQWSARAP